MSHFPNTATQTSTMRAISPRTWGPPEVLTEITVARPVPGPTEILVRVHAAGVNPTDWKSRASGQGLWEDPPILGHEVSGVVEAVGSGVRLFRPGDEVCGMPRFPHQVGAYAEYVTAPARHFAPKPVALDHVSAAALPLAGLTAWQAFTQTAHVQPGDQVLVHAAAGGVGHLAVQIATALGARVIGTARAAKHAFVRELGAQEVIDYTQVDFTEVLSEIDVVLDPIGAAYGPRSLQVLRAGGTLVSLSSSAEDHLIPEAASRGIQAGFMLVEPDYAGLGELVRLVDEGKLRTQVQTVLPLSEAAAAHALGEKGRTTGKIVLAVSDSAQNR